jgi:hypothetical protein
MEIARLASAVEGQAPPNDTLSAIMSRTHARLCTPLQRRQSAIRE